MAVRSVWKGYLKLSLVTCGVELTNAVSHAGRFKHAPHAEIAFKAGH